MKQSRFSNGTIELIKFWERGRFYYTLLLLGICISHYFGLFYGCYCWDCYNFGGFIVRTL